MFRCVAAARSVRLWHVFVLIRIVLTLRLQPGYIHPDEFFQSVEVVSGDVLGTEVHRTWEFNPDSPIRSMALPYILYAPAYFVLQILAKLNWLSMDTYTLLLGPRVSLLILSLIIDTTVYRTLKLHRGLSTDSAMLVYSTSYISLIYYTRTLSNTLESFIFIAILYLVQKEMIRIVRHFKAFPRSKLTQCARADEADMYGFFEWIQAPNIVALATCIAVGFFNRPTFLLFAYTPFLYYLYDGALPQTISDFISATKIAYRKFCLAVLFSVPAVLMIVHADTMYYKDMQEIVDTYELPFFEDVPRAVYNLVFKFGLTDLLAITPLNFIQYNTKAENLAQHGTHSRFTHFFVNQPMLFGTLFFCVLFDAVLLVATSHGSTMRRTSALEPTETKFWLHCYLVPLLLLSVFPHQEPRFLIPLLLPLVVLYSHLIFGKKSQPFYKYSWILLNLCGAAFYGYLHQGGLVRSIDFMRETALNTSEDTTIHVLYSHTYMPPKHLFMIISEPARTEDVIFTKEQDNQRSTSKTTELFNHQYYTPDHKLSIYDMQGKPVSALEEKISAIIRVKDKEHKPRKTHSHLFYVVAPSTLELDLCLNSSLTYQYRFVKQFSGHLSMEEPANSAFLQTWSDRGFPCSLCVKESPCKLHPLHILSPVMGLNVYRVYRKENSEV